MTRDFLHNLLRLLILIAFVASAVGGRIAHHLVAHAPHASTQDVCSQCRLLMAAEEGATGGDQALVVWNTPHAPDRGKNSCRVCVQLAVGLSLAEQAAEVVSPTPPPRIVLGADQFVLSARTERSILPRAPPEFRPADAV